MPFCTIVEFEWDEAFDREGFSRRPFPEAARLPPPSRVAGFEVTSHVVS
jgi:hypothetical protein